VSALAYSVEEGVYGNVGGLGGVVVGELTGEQGDDLEKQRHGYPLGQIGPDDSLVHGAAHEGGQPGTLLELRPWHSSSQCIWSRSTGTGEHPDDALHEPVQRHRDGALSRRA